MTENHTSPKDKTTFKETPFLALKGFLMGSADIVPGVSGGTIALIVGIYERLLNAINSVNSRFIKAFFSLKWKKAFEEVHWLFVITLFAGIFGAFAFFTRVVPLQVYMFTHPEIVYGLFFGLIVGSIYILVKSLEQFSIAELMMIIVGIGLGLWVVLLVPVETPEHPAFIFLSGSIAICAMILPGISGSYLLLIMRKYDFLLSQIGLIGSNETVDALLAILPFILGAIVGLATFSRVLSWLLERYHSKTIALLIGFMIGSLYVIWPFQHREFIEIRETESVLVTNERVQELSGKVPDENLPEYSRLGREFASDSGQLMIEIETIKKKMIKSEPFIPGWLGQKPGESPNVGGGILGMLIGILMIGGLEKLREK